MSGGLPEELLEKIVAVARRVPSKSMESVCQALVRSGTNESAATAQPWSMISDPDARESLKSVVCELAGRAAGDATAPLVWALRAAAATDEWYRDNEDLDLVWTGPVPHGGTFRKTEQAILEVIRSAKEELWLISFAAYKLSGIRDALLDAASRGVAITLLIEDAEESQGKVTFSGLKSMGSEVAKVATVYVWPLEKRPTNDKGEHGSLHVKAALADDDLLFVTSANLTEFAMSLNMELGLLARGGKMARRVRDHLRWMVETHALTVL